MTREAVDQGVELLACVHEQDLLGAVYHALLSDTLLLYAHRAPFLQ